MSSREKWGDVVVYQVVMTEMMREKLAEICHYVAMLDGSAEAAILGRWLDDAADLQVGKGQVNICRVVK